jgi:hypothetical protein
VLEQLKADIELRREQHRSAYESVLEEFTNQGLLKTKFHILGKITEDEAILDLINNKLKGVK